MILNVACIQISSQNDMEFNISKTISLINKAADMEATLVCLPENVAFMGANAEELFANTYYPNDHPALNKLQETASKLKIWILIGSLAVKIKNNDKIANRSILINDSGEISAQYDKIHLYDAQVAGGETHRESDRYIAGDKATIAETPWGKLGMTICYDLRFPKLYRTIAQKGAHIITVPSAFTEFTGKLHWHTLLRARAIENASFIIAPAQTGSHPAGRKTYGHSLIIDPWGKIIAEAEENEGVIISEINSSIAIKARKQLPSLEHDRNFDIKNFPL